MKRSIRVLGTAAVAAIGLLASSSSAHADTTFDTGMVTVMAETRAVKVDVGGITVVSVNKVSNPGVQVRVTLGEGSQPVASTVFAPGENGCSAVDDPSKGTLNRSITVQGGPWANVYVKAQFTTTTPIGLSSTTVLEPLGAAGLTVTGVTLVTGVPVNICVA
ncbi:MAG: hypothetical protein M3163_03810 [Actinomycetota bacterium]|nr:hypothetical protein [Actinomycetota bacterium]